MQNKNNKRSKIFLNIALAALITVTATSASMMMGCGSKSAEVSATPDSPVTETKVVNETQIVSEIVEITGEASDNSKDSSNNNSSVNNSGNNSSDKNNGNNSSDSGNNSGNNSNNNSNGGNSSGNNSGNNSNNNSNDGNSGNNSGNNSNGNSNNNSNNSNGGNSGNNSNNNNGNSSEVLKIDGKSFNVGDTVTCRLSIKTPDIIENFQGEIVYDTKYLECTKAKLIGEARGGSVINFRTTPGIIKFNGSSGVDGYDFLKGADMIEITYKVKSSGSTTPTDKWEIVRKLSENGKGINYISNNKPSNGMTSTLSYSK